MTNDTSASEQLAVEEERIRLLEETRSAQRLNSLKSSAMGLRNELLDSNDVSIAPGSGR
jgi:hypothetical protein